MPLLNLRKTPAASGSRSARSDTVSSLDVPTGTPNSENSTISSPKDDPEARTVLRKSSLIELTDVSKVYGFGDATTIALDEVSLTVEKGEFIAIMGPSGSGKTTLMNIIGLLDRPTHGVYRLDGTQVSKFGKMRQAKYRRDKVGHIFQSFSLLPRLTLLENVSLPLAYKRVRRKKRLETASRMLEQVGLKDREYYQPSQLSGGQLQRGAIARALVNNPHIIIADEPTGNLDSTSARVVMELLSEIHAMGNTILMVTHNPSLTRYASRIIYMLDGGIVYDEATAVGTIPERVQRAVNALRSSDDEEKLANVSAMMEAIPDKGTASSQPKKPTKKHKKRRGKR